MGCSLFPMAEKGVSGSDGGQSSGYFVVEKSSWDRVAQGLVR